MQAATPVLQVLPSLQAYAYSLQPYVSTLQPYVLQVLPNLPSTPLYAEQFTGYGNDQLTHTLTPILARPDLNHKPEPNLNPNLNPNPHSNPNPNSNPGPSPCQERTRSSSSRTDKPYVSSLQPYLCAQSATLCVQARTRSSSSRTCATWASASMHSLEPTSCTRLLKRGWSGAAQWPTRDRTGLLWGWPPSRFLRRPPGVQGHGPGLSHALH